jgi:50S ribosomal subunit-associated GTPase HflX
VVVGYFSARQKDFAVRMDAASVELTTRGARVVGRVVQRRGVSNGGARKMTLPYSSRTLMSSGKVREVAALCERSGADAVVFLNALTEHQRQVLTEIFGCPTVSLTEALPPAPTGVPRPGVRKCRTAPALFSALL